jgi:tetratricopeptide (TPR) repeat protein
MLADSLENAPARLLIPWCDTMAVDPYAPCPCGSGKKVKFCCSDLVGDIEKIHRMIEGDQPRAALRHAEQTLAKHPGRASLLDLKATLELSLGEADEAGKTIDELLRIDPQNPSAHACRAMLLASTEEGKLAVAPLQKALALIDREMPQRVFEAIGVVGRALLGGGHIVAAQAHLWLHVALAPRDDPRALELLVNLNHYSGLPLLLRDNLRLRDWPADVSWRAEAEQASRLADLGKWTEATAIIDRLGTTYGAEPTLLYNRTVLAGRLADDQALVAGLHAYAQMPVPLDDAVEAEAIAQLLDSDAKDETLDSVVRTHEIKDLDALLENLSADRRVQAFEIDPAQFKDDEPRPRHAFVLLDRPLPESGAGIARGDVPSLAGVISIFGRQTNRPERLDLTTDKGPNFERALTAVAEAGGDALGEMIDQRVVGSTTPTEQALNWRWHFPVDTPLAERRKLVAEERHIAITERWPEVLRPGLGGKTPLEAAADPELRIPLMAAVLVLEQGSNNRGDAASVAVLRDKLGLPQPEPIDGAAESVAALPLVRVSRLGMESVTDDDLVQLYRRSILLAARSATTLVAQEAVRRPSVATYIPPAEAYRRLIAAEDDDQRALALIDEARQHAESAGESTAKWDLAELELHIDSGNGERAQAMFATIEQKHLDDPQVAAAVYRLLYETGVISPDELMSQPPLHQHAEPHAPAIAGAVAAATPPESSNVIWTPGSDRPAGGKKSSLWTPS